ncbi:glycosyltransferase family 1 protein [Anaerocolumna sedimenticola]|uniref:Glycosyltransferase family 1 protein n=1 Tax=Anaerocolumna sedimenticola TaxID=2696063 RepID=A0A6P1TQ37_9FIRM|nr:glycosyltransferase family 1 protein [Anaerocolumna sedimenticola]QHQ62329.1 glycosyltransferase family 1 protein [Anaerocolumna sedimenticola]
MKVLLLTDEVWNDTVYKNNILSNWFNDSAFELANIYLAPGVPENKCCSKYFQITDKMMLKSLLTKQKAGVKFSTLDKEQAKYKIKINKKESNKYLRPHRKTASAETIRFFNDILWMRGKFDKTSLSSFIQDFDPDIIFSLRQASRKMLNLERVIANLTDKPIVVFSGDDEYLLDQFKISPLYWLRRFHLRKDLRKNMKFYRKYYTLSEKQADLYKDIFKVDTGVLRKSGEFRDNFNIKEVHFPVKLVYAGSLNNNRWKILIQIKKALEKMNKNTTRMTLSIYPSDKITKHQKNLLADGIQTFIKPPVTADEFKKVYRNADIILLLEAFDKKNRKQKKFNFSEKVVDCLASNCCTLAICPIDNPGYEYLNKQDAAVCIENTRRIYGALKKLYLQHAMMYEYQKKAWECGIYNHRKSVIQDKLYKDFKNIVDTKN